MTHALWQQRCLEVVSRLHHVAVVDETRGLIDITVGDAPRRIATFRPRDAVRRTTSLRTLEPLGKPGGSRAFSADGSPFACGSETVT
jgi:hypothetical protein